MTESKDKPTKEQVDLIQHMEDVLIKAEQRVLFPTEKGIQAEIVGHTVDLSPLPIFFAKQLSSKLQGIIEMSSSEDKKKQETWKNEASGAIADCFCECVLILCEYYEIEEVDLEAVQRTHSMAEIKSIVLAQAEVNETDDFLLAPLQAIIGVLSVSTEAIKRVRERTDTIDFEEKLSSTAALVKDGE